MEEKIKTLASYRLKRSKEDFETAKLNYEHGMFSQAVNRSYYAILHALRALLAYATTDFKLNGEPMWRIMAEGKRVHLGDCWR